MDLLAELNPVQTQAVQAAPGPVLVLAGPGSGKTRVLTHRIAHLIQESGVRPYQILAVTFTNKAAREMVSRLETIIGEDTARLTIGTFHAICVRILRREAAYLNLGSNFGIYDADDQQRLVTRIIKEFDLDTNAYRPSFVQGAISRAKNDLITADTYRAPSYRYEAVSRVFERYEQIKAENNALDFDDLLQRTEELFRTQEEVRERYQGRYAHLLVDEFQDTNKAQYEIIHHLAGPRRNVFVVGDEDQSIYSWRGADFRNVQRFRQDFPDAQVFKLEQNYRSTQTILDAAQAIIAHNAQRTDKTLWTRRQGGAAIQLFEAYDEREEAEYVVAEIQRLVAGGKARPSECAVMFRTNFQSRALEDAFMRHGLSYKLVGGTRFYQRREVKDVLAYLRVVYNPDDEVSLARIINVPGRGIGARTLEQLGTWATNAGLSMGAALLEWARGRDGRLPALPVGGRSGKQLQDFAAMLALLVRAREERNLSDLLRLVLERSAYLEYLRDGTEEGEDRISNVKELFTATERYDAMPPTAALPTLLEEVALVSDVDEADWQSEAVTLLTLHAAKGLEFDTVLIVGMEEGICPHARSMENPDDMEEERRLCYVGITRAKNRLYLLRTFRRTIYGNSETREASRFLADLPPALVQGNDVRRAAARPSAPTPANREERRALFSQRRGLAQQIADRRREETAAAGQDRAAARSRRPLNGPADAPAGGRPTSSAAPRAPRQEPGSAPQTGSASTPAQTEVHFYPGEAVNHPIFGEGIVVASKLVSGDEEVTIAFEGRGIKRLMASYARLEKSG
jgi:DNA helicase-2/ATP-dependent DNA helicase PcrA